jgi:hypothetical protein
MPPMRCRLFTGLTVLSLGLSLTVVVLWVRSYFRADSIVWAQQSKRANVWTSSWGELGWIYQYQIGPPPYGIGGNFGHHTFPPGRLDLPATNPGAWQHMGFAYIGGTNGIGEFFIVEAPHWAVVLLTAAVAVWLIRWQRRHPRNITSGLCTACGYNLTGNTSGICPECGTRTTAGVKA